MGQGVIEIAKALGKCQGSLQCISMARNGIPAAAGDSFVDAARSNDQLLLLDLAANDLSVKQLCDVGQGVHRNRTLSSESRRRERRERFKLFAAEAETREYGLQLEAERLETEALQERRLERMRVRLQKWAAQQGDEEREHE